MLEIYKVYKYIFPNNKIYIGITKQSITKRHSSGYYHNQIMQEAIWKYGWNHIITEILFDNLTKTEAEKIEAELIKKYNTTDPLVGYNILIGRKTC